MVKAKVKPNRYKPETNHSDKPGMFDAGAVDFCLKWILTVAFVSILSLLAIFAYDMVTQSDLFSVKHIHITGNQRVNEQEIIKLVQLDREQNIFKLNLHTLEKRITSHPWIQAASVDRNFSSELSIRIIEHEPLAIVKIENIADIVINTKGYPFKEYDPMADRLDSLPVITGLDLTKGDNSYLFDGLLFNSVMDFLHLDFPVGPVQIRADSQTGITVETTDIYGLMPAVTQESIPIKLGFDHFKLKLKKAKTIGSYIEQNFPDRHITAMDLFNPNKIFIKTIRGDTGHEASKKGV